MCGGSLISAARTAEVGDALPPLLSNLSQDLLPAGPPGPTLHSHFHFLPVETQGFLQGPQPAHSKTITTLVSLQPLINVSGNSLESLPLQMDTLLMGSAPYRRAAQTFSAFSGWCLPSPISELEIFTTGSSFHPSTHPKLNIFPGGESFKKKKPNLTFLSS